VIAYHPWYQPSKQLMLSHGNGDGHLKKYPILKWRCTEKRSRYAEKNIVCCCQSRRRKRKCESVREGTTTENERFFPTYTQTLDQSKFQKNVFLLALYTAVEFLMNAFIQSRRSLLPTHAHTHTKSFLAFVSVLFSASYLIPCAYSTMTAPSPLSSGLLAAFAE